MNLLSLKGGSVRGLISLIFLKKIEEITGKPISEIFHAYGGSSVGSLLVSALTLSENGKESKYTAHQVYELFLKHVYNSFSWTWYSYISSGLGLFGPKYTNDGLINIIDECCGDAHVNHILKPIIFPAFDRKSGKAYYFDKVKDHHLKIKDVIMACTSIPSYFPSYKTKINEQEYDFLDSAILSNDPSCLLYLKTRKENPTISKSKYILLCVGTGLFPNVVSDKNGLLSWLPNIVNTLVTGSEENEAYQLSLSIPAENYLVLDLPLNHVYNPDDIKPSTIEYYTKSANDWLAQNESLMQQYCNKLLNNLKLSI